MIKTEFAFTSNDGTHQIIATIWAPDNKNKIKAVVQISHGMVEHIDRYHQLAERLTDQGFAVVGNDHLGHGRSVNDKEEYGYFVKSAPSETVVKDLYTLTRKTKEMFWHKPYFIIGHSMGSFLVRRYIMTYGSKVNGVIILGTGWKPKVTVEAGRAFVWLMSKIHGDNYRSNLVDKMVMGNSDRRIKEGDTGNWLTKEQAEVDKYKKDPYCNFIFTLNGFRMLLETISFVQKGKNIKKIPKGLPMYIASGAEDPVGDYGKGVEKTYKHMKKAGIEDVTLKLYENDRHELINETDREQVYADLINWLNSHMPEPR